MDIKELHSFKLSDAIKFRDQLNPKLFTNEKLDPAVRKQLLIIAQDFMEELGISGLHVKDITISGSNAAYTWTSHSDLDLHILVDISKLPENEVYRELFNAKKTVYNDSHDIKVHDIPVELYVQDTAEPVKSLGEYSVMDDDWINFPKKRKATPDLINTKLKFKKLADLIKIAMKSKDITKINNLLTLIKRYRQAGLDQGGEFSPENLAFKSLRSQGVIDKLYALRNTLHSKELSIENINEERMKFLRPGELTGSWTDSELRALGFKQAENGRWYIPQSKWDELVKARKIYEEGTLAERLAIELEDYDPNGPPPGPEFKPTMPQGTVRVDVSDVYDWYKLGQHISNLKGLGKHDFGKGPPSTIMAFGSEDEEHKYIKDLEQTGLTTTDIDPVDPKQPKGMKRQKVDPTYNVNEDEGTNNLAWRIDFGDKFKELSSLIPEREGKIYLMPMDDSALDTYSNLTGEEPDQIERTPNQVFKISGDALVGDMSIINEIVNAMGYMQINKSNLPLKRQYESHIAKLKKQYLATRVPYSQYRSGQFDMPEILAKPSQIKKIDKSVTYNDKTGKIEIKGMKRQKVDPTYNVNEESMLNEFAAFHGTFRPALARFKPLSHFGSIKAATERLENVKYHNPKFANATKGYIYELDLGITAPGIVKDYPEIVDPSAASMEKLARWSKDLIQDPRFAQYQGKNPISGESTNGVNILKHFHTIAKSGYWAERYPYTKFISLWINFLRAVGIDGLKYKNRIENVGSESYITFDPDQIKILGKPKVIDLTNAESATHNINESEQLLEINFNDPELISEVLNFNIRCGFEAESIWNVTPVYINPWEDVTAWSDLSFMLSRRENERATDKYNQWLDDKLDPFIVKLRRNWINDAIDDENEMLEFYESYYGQDDLSDEARIDAVNSKPMRNDFKYWIKEKANDLYEAFSEQAQEEIRDEYTMDDFIESEYGSLEDFADQLNFYPDFNADIDSTVSLDSLAQDKFEPWMLKSSKFQNYKTGTYHSTTGEDNWRIETDSTISDYDTGDQMGAEIISPVYETPASMLSEMLSLFKYFDKTGVETNETTGLHVTMSLPGASQQPNMLKMGLLLGDPYVLKLFGRQEGTQGSEYTQSQFLHLKSIAQNITDPNNLRELETILNRNLRISKYMVANFKGGGLIEFRAAGGTDYHEKTEEIKKTVARYATIILAGHDSKFMQQEYYTMLGRLAKETFLSPKGDVLTSSFVNVFNRLTSYVAKQIEPDFSNFEGDIKALKTMIDSTGATSTELAKARELFIELLDKLVSQPNLKPVTDMESRIIRTTAKRLGLNSIEQIVDELGITNWIGDDMYKVRAFSKLDQLLKTKVKRPANLQTVTESIKTINKLGPQLFVPKRDLLEGIKPNAELWTSTATKTSNGYTSDWVEWCKENEPNWIRPEGVMYDVLPGARILVINTDKDALEVAKKYGIKIKDAMELFMKMRWDILANDYDAIHHVPKERYNNLFMSTWDVESTAWFNKKHLTNPRKVAIDMNGELVVEGASGYIPSNAEKDDPRFKTALTVDIKPDTMKKNAKKLGWNISRAGIPPLLRK